MISVQIAELRNRLSHYLGRVGQGEAILVCNRDRVVARIEPVHDAAAILGDEARRVRELERRGILQPPKEIWKQGELRRWLAGPRPRVRGSLAVEALLAEREEGS
ncbi:MAG: type II toxin-antitoxin system prevent-host-death family antitoxin [Deltaproteobacteria bacterium]|nr:type II toxin-antitoxin system prevent-host-death family antitoxin [Deltaproteobacteria bacterium]